MESLEKPGREGFNAGEVGVVQTERRVESACPSTRVVDPRFLSSIMASYYEVSTICHANAL
jgi:hypothetical protein